MCSQNGSCKTALKNTLATEDNVEEGQTTLMRFSSGTMTGFSKCKQMLVLCPEGMLEHDAWKGNHAGLPSGMSPYQRRKRRTNLESKLMSAETGIRQKVILFVA